MSIADSPYKNLPTKDVESAAQINDLAVEGQESSTEQRRQSRVFIHKKWKESSIRLTDVEKSYPAIYKALITLPWKLVQWWPYGVTLSRRVYQGVKRNGPSYPLTWLSENHVELTTDQRMIVSCVEFYHSFFTYDDLFEYLKDHHWGELQFDKGLDHYPTLDEQVQKEERERKAMEAQIVKRKQKIKQLKGRETYLLATIAASENNLKNHDSEFDHLVYKNFKETDTKLLEAVRKELSELEKNASVS